MFTPLIPQQFASAHRVSWLNDDVVYFIHFIYKYSPGCLCYLASVTAVCMASSICCPAAACSSGIGTASRTPLWRPRESVLAVRRETASCPLRKSNLLPKIWLCTSHTVTDTNLAYDKEASVELIYFLLSKHMISSDNYFKLTNKLSCFFSIGDIIGRCVSTFMRKESWETFWLSVSGYTDPLSFLGL